MNSTDLLAKPIGQWNLDVYDGDLRYGVIPGMYRDAPLLAEITPEKLQEAAGWEAREWLRRCTPNGFVLNPLVEVIEGFNLVTTTGKGVILDRLFTLSAVTGVTQMGVGTSNTAAAVGDTTLTGLVLQAFDATPIRAGLVVTSISTYATGSANITWAELGSFTAVPTMLNRIAPIGPFTKTSAVSIVVTQTLTQG